MKKLRLILLPLLLTACVNRSAVTNGPDMLALNGDGSASISARVAENHNNCALESCYLTVHPDGQEVHVIYSHPTGTCSSDGGADIARSLKPGDRVIISGQFTKEVGFSVVDICSGGNGSLQVGG